MTRSEHSPGGRVAGSRRRPASPAPRTLTGFSERRPSAHQVRGMRSDVVLDMGWGRLVMGQTFDDLDAIVSALRAEETGRRDICVYPRDPQVLVGLAPDELFVDPSLVYRLDLHRYRPRGELIRGVFVRTVTAAAEMGAINDLYAHNGMVLADAVTMWANHRTRPFTYLVAEDQRTGRVVGTVTGVDHELAFGDPEGGTSLWCLAVDGQDAPPGTGEALVRVLAERYAARGRDYLDLSVLHDNTAAIALYRKLGFTRTAAVCVKRKNPINTPLFSAPPPGLDDVNPYARIIAEEALRRGIRVEVTDAEWGELRLSIGGRSVLTRESLSEFTSAVAMSRCDDKRVTRRVMERAGVRVPRGAVAADGDLAAARALLAECGELVVKPEHGIAGRLDQPDIGNTRDPATGLPVYSLYTGDKRPTAAMLANLDTLVFDIQDVGVRFYTYTCTMKYALEEAAKHGKRFVVLDRPNPITGTHVEGPVQDRGLDSFVGCFALPVRHGMTEGELAQMFKGEEKLDVDLQVVKMDGWERGDWWDATHLPWRDPSPNLRSLNAALLYPGLALLEYSKNYSVGRGTDAPFEQVGAPWIDGRQLARELNGRGLPGVRAYPTRFTPTSSNLSGKSVEGVRFVLTDRDRFDSTRVGVELAAAMAKLYPGKIDFAANLKLIGSEALVHSLQEGAEPSVVEGSRTAGLPEFLQQRSKYLLY